MLSNWEITNVESGRVLSIQAARMRMGLSAEKCASFGRSSNFRKLKLWSTVNVPWNCSMLNPAKLNGRFSSSKVLNVLRVRWKICSRYLSPARRRSST